MGARVLLMVNVRAYLTFGQQVEDVHREHVCVCGQCECKKSLDDPLVSTREASQRLLQLAVLRDHSVKMSRLISAPREPSVGLCDERGLLLDGDGRLP